MPIKVRKQKPKRLLGYVVLSTFGLTLGELRSLTGLVKTVLLTLDDSGVDGDEAVGLEGLAEVSVDQEKCACDAKACCAFLCGIATTLDGDVDVEPSVESHEIERPEQVDHEILVGEVLLSLDSVDGDLSGSTLEEDTGHCRFPASSCIIDGSLVGQSDNLSSSHNYFSSL